MVEEKEESLSLLRTMDVLISTCNYDIKMPSIALSVQCQGISSLCCCTHLGGQLLLPVHQTLDVGRVVAAALAGRDGAFEGGAGDL